MHVKRGLVTFKMLFACYKHEFLIRGYDCSNAEDLLHKHVRYRRNDLTNDGECM